MAKHCALADVVITTAQVFGRKAPIIVTKDMVQKMSPGSLLVDLAVETGGNVEGAELGKEVDVNGVTIIGLPNLAGRVQVHASQMLAANMGHLLNEFWDKEQKKFHIDRENEIVAGCLVTHEGSVVHPALQK